MAYNHDLLLKSLMQKVIVNIDKLKEIALRKYFNFDLTDRMFKEFIYWNTSERFKMIVLCFRP